MYNVYHGSWRDFTTAVGALFAPKWIRYLVQRLLDVGSWTSSVRFAHTAHASLMGAYAPKRSANRALSEEDGVVRLRLWGN